LEAWLGLIGALGGVAITGILERLRVSDQLRLEKRLQYDQERRTRLEELFEVIDDVRTRYDKSFTNALMRVEYGRQEEQLSRLPISRMRMLVGIYAPQATDALAQFEVACQQYSDALAATIEADKLPKAERQQILGDLERQSTAIQTCCDRLADEVVRTARSLAPK
jgi:hypothetical protein